MNFTERYRGFISVMLGIGLCGVVLAFWSISNRNLDGYLKSKVSDTNKLVVQQFGDILNQNVHLLANLKRRLQFTDGAFFEYWSEDAKSIISQEPSFLFVEWIDQNMIIQRVEPMEDNEEALGLDISTLDYRSSDWLLARNDSVFNVTHWLTLTQGESAFLVDEPVYFDGEFQGTITAGMDFTDRFNTVMQGFEQYYVKVRDDKGTVFYTYGSTDGIDAYQDYSVTDIFTVNDANASVWTVTMVPNHEFAEVNAFDSYKFNLILTLIVCLVLAASLFYMLKASAAEKSLRKANYKLRALIDSAPIAIYVIDSEGNVVDLWNRAAEKMLGWKQEEVRGNILPFITDDNEEEVHDTIKQSIVKGGISDLEVSRERKDGSRRDFRINIGSITGEEKHMLVLLEDITKEKSFERQLKESLHEKEVLLREVHHRVKNNLAIMVGLLELQAEEAEDKKSRNLLSETKNRIFSIFEVHELLYQSEDFTKINFSNYILTLLERIKSTYQHEQGQVAFRTDIDNFRININLAIPLGLLLNELITNSYLHAFGQTDDPAISISFKKENGFIDMKYSDNGKGMDIEYFKKGSSMGLTIIRTLLRQLAADYSLDENGGFNIHFIFRAKEKGSHSNL